MATPNQHSYTVRALIPKAEILRVAEETGLLATTIEKDYVLGWILFGIGQSEELTHWMFKGGTCLKKCYFDTYRFSEDLDFTLPQDVTYERESILASLRGLASGSTTLRVSRYPRRASPSRNSATAAATSLTRPD